MTDGQPKRSKRTLLLISFAALLLGLIWWHAALSIQQMRERALGNWMARQSDLAGLLALESLSDFNAGLEAGLTQDRLEELLVQKLSQYRPLEGHGQVFIWTRQGPVFDQRLGRARDRDLEDMLRRQESHGAQGLSTLADAVAQGGKGKGLYQWTPSVGPELVCWESIRLPAGTAGASGAWTVFVATPQSAVLKSHTLEGRIRTALAAPALASLITLGSAWLLHALTNRARLCQQAAKGAQDALRLATAQRARLAELFETLPVAQAMLDREGAILRANRAFRQLVGMSPAPEQPPVPFAVLANRAENAAAILEVLTSGLAPVGTVETVLTNPTGPGRRYAALLRPCPCGGSGLEAAGLEARSPVATLTLVDITELRQMETLLEESRALLDHRVRVRTEDLARAARRVEDSRRRLQALLDNLPDIAWLKDVSGRYISVNVSFAKSLGLENPADIAGKVDQHLLEPEEALFTREIDLKVVSSRQTQRVEQPYTLPGLGVRWHEVIRTPIFDEAGMVVGIVGIARDMTERRRMLQELRDSEAELRRLNELLLYSQEEERTRIRQELHDSVGQLLTGIKWAVERAKLSMARSKAPKEAQSALADVVPMVQNTEEELSRILLALRPKALDELGLEVAAQSMCREFAQMHPEVRVVTRIAVDSATEAGLDPDIRTAAFRILQEALSNAGSHSSASKVTVQLGVRGGWLRLAVGDNGRGFDPAEPSPGLGLHNFQSRARYAGGSCTVHTRLRAGTVVVARLPATPRPA